MATRKGLSVVRQGLQVSKDAKLKPGLSKSGDEARHRALVLYKAWYKSIPYIVKRYHVPLTQERCRQKLRERFEEKRHVEDLRARDILIVKGQNELVEVMNTHMQVLHVMSYFKDTVTPRPTEFMDKFYDGHDP